MYRHLLTVTILFTFVSLLLTLRIGDLRNVKYRLTLYNSYHPGMLVSQDMVMQYDCLYYDVIDNIAIAEDDEHYIWANQLITYCIRPTNANSILCSANFSRVETVQKNYTFFQLKENNISSSQLLDWSAPIDLIEHYQEYLDEENDNDLTDRSSATKASWTFYNCTLPSFGTYCQYFFAATPISLEEYLEMTHNNLFIIHPPSAPCYAHLTCVHAYDLCLDWREICDGKADCMDGVDEQFCWQLEANQCGKNEYRCHDGQCIPLDFENDDELNPDCMDQTDERVIENNRGWCVRDPSFRCQETKCYPVRGYSLLFSCGDGSCTYGTEMCRNMRDRFKLGWSNRFFQVPLTWLCSKVMSCLTGRYINLDTCSCGSKHNISCASMAKAVCPSDPFRFPEPPVIFENVYFIYETAYLNDANIFPRVICFDPGLCSIRSVKMFRISEHACVFYEDVNDQHYTFSSLEWTAMIAYMNSHLFDICQLNNTRCPHPSLYRCKDSSKCISTSRLHDGRRDCRNNDDEYLVIDTCSLKNMSDHPFKCSGQHLCLSQLMVNDGTPDCQNGEDELNPVERYLQNHIVFQFICDGSQEMLPTLINGQNETDETECDRRFCNNSYTRCNFMWNCPGGEDELQCENSTMYCPAQHHLCIFPFEQRIICLPIEKVNDGIIDCLGGADERHLCRDMYPFKRGQRYHCWNISKCVSIDSMDECRTSVDNTLLLNVSEPFKCSTTYTAPLEEYLCGLIDRLDYDLLQRHISNQKNNVGRRQISDSILSLSEPRNYNDFDEYVKCFMGVPLPVSAPNSQINRCLCPPNAYGSFCQYQNQRVSLIVQARSASEWRSMFSFIFILLTDKNEIESHDHRYYSPSTDCSIKWNIYLLYRSRPKNQINNYSVRIDVYKRDVSKLDYRGSWYYLLRFSFLPVHRLAVQITIPPRSAMNSRVVCPLDCYGHGSCVIANSRASQTFFICRCNPGWVGAQCEHAQQPSTVCTCAPGSLCISSYPTALCVCPLGRGGPRCYIRLNPCQESEECLNGGHCVPDDERRHSFFVKKCVCTEDFWGENCELPLTKFTITFHKAVPIPFLVFLHILQDVLSSDNRRITFFKKIMPYDISATVRAATKKFDLMFVEFQSNYYQVYLDDINSHENILTTYLENRCLSTKELFNSTFIQFHLLRRVKSYHELCGKYDTLTCFFDEVHLCTCEPKRQAVCVLFNHEKTDVCREDSNSCENGGQCFQDNANCPSTSACLCQDCFFGTKCQFSTQGFSLSLDAILGYQIQPNTNFRHQLPSVIFCLVLVVIMFIVSGLSGSLSTVIFSSQNLLKNECGIYLISTSIVSILTMIIFTLKFTFLLLAQLGTITNWTFLLIQCKSVDFFLRTFFNYGNWLNACIAANRTSMILKHVNAQNTHSKRRAKQILIVLFLLIVLSNLHDPIHRHLITDEDEKRTWCIVRYPSLVENYNNIIQILHFFLPFAFNIASALMIIITVAQKRSYAHKERSFKSHFQKQLSTNKHLLISPIALILLALPRLVISLMSGCMTSTREPWIFLTGYFTSFTPPLLVFAVFVLPSKTYKAEFRNIWMKLKR